MIGFVSVALAMYEVFAWLTGNRTISRQVGLGRVVVFTWYGWLGVHLATEAITEWVGVGVARGLRD